MVFERIKGNADVIGQRVVGFAAMFGGAEFCESFGPLMSCGKFETEQFVYMRIVSELERRTIFACSAFARSPL